MPLAWYLVNTVLILILVTNRNLPSGCGKAMRPASGKSFTLLYSVITHPLPPKEGSSFPAWPNNVVASAESRQRKNSLIKLYCSFDVCTKIDPCCSEEKVRL